MLLKELAPIARIRLFREGENLLRGLFVFDDDVSHAPALGLAKIGSVAFEIRADLVLRNVGWSRQSASRLRQYRLAQDLADALLRVRLLIEFFLARLLSEQFDVDDFLEKLAAPLGRLVAKPIELVHPFERGGIVAEGDGAITHLGDDARRHLGGETGGQGPGVGAFGAIERPLVARCAEEDEQDRAVTPRGLHAAGAYYSRGAAASAVGHESCADDSAFGPFPCL